MLQKGEKITIRNSKRLVEKGLTSLVNKKGVVTKTLTSQGKLIGAYVDVKMGRKVKNYYIPVNSIEGVESINRMRTISLLKETIL